MELLLIVGNAKDIFVYNMAKWLKAKMDINIDVFEFNSNDLQGNDYNVYGKIGIINTNLIINKINGLRIFSRPITNSIALKTFLKGKHYDIIHCHWIKPEVALSSFLKQYCKKLVVSFWGGEKDKMKLFYSHKVYIMYLKRFLKSTDAIINSPSTIRQLRKLFPEYNGLFFPARFGSAPLENIYKILKREGKDPSKAFWKIPTGKATLMIGYSGKRIHNHIRIIEELKKEKIQDKIHLIAPMTRGSGQDYTNEVRNKLESSGYSYTLLNNRFLSDEEIARLRIATDVTFQYSDFDAFSYSILEVLCSRSLVIYGGWLDYDEHLNDMHLKAFKTSSVSDGMQLLKQYVDNPEIFAKDLDSNYSYGLKIGSWSECIENWVDAYKHILNVEVF